jgi:hypothetical protein
MGCEWLSNRFLAVSDKEGSTGKEDGKAKTVLALGNTDVSFLADHTLEF